MNLSNDEAQLLINICKKLKDKVINIPSPGDTRKYQSTDLEEIREFIYRMRQAKGNTSQRHKATYNLFYNGIQLLRLDTDGNGLHTNIDGSTIPPHTPHIHIYDEIELDHNAYLLPKNFTNPADIFQTLLDFFSYSNIIDIEQLEIKEQKGLVFHDD